MRALYAPNDIAHGRCAPFHVKDKRAYANWPATNSLMPALLTRISGPQRVDNLFPVKPAVLDENLAGMLATDHHAG
jgi:hypothetical protein